MRDDARSCKGRNPRLTSEAGTRACLGGAACIDRAASPRVLPKARNSPETPVNLTRPLLTESVLGASFRAAAFRLLGTRLSLRWDHPNAIASSDVTGVPFGAPGAVRGASGGIVCRATRHEPGRQDERRRATHQNEPRRAHEHRIGLLAGNSPAVCREAFGNAVRCSVVPTAC